ncbi:MAG: hypothetical protein KDI74_19220, partial [Gammaproteobacteria bacterium]|nr:hypothetical protein [Gammaproteobacteria bacterium]
MNEIKVMSPLKDLANIKEPLYTIPGCAGRRAIVVNNMLPQCYPNYKTVRRRFQQKKKKKMLRSVMTDLANTSLYEDAFYEAEYFIDATFASAKGGSVVGIRNLWQLLSVIVCRWRSVRT